MDISDIHDALDPFKYDFIISFTIRLHRYKVLENLIMF